jgi:pimeloyl-ACP methyl ester carboxylesterase
LRLLSALLSVALVIGLVPLGLPPAPVQAQSAFFETDCPMPLPAEAIEGEDITCGWVEVPAQHSAPSGPTIRLMVAVIPSTSDSPAPDPLTFAQGGPGGSTLDLYALLAGELGAPFRAERDIVLVEQRGTLYSEPYLFCDEAFDAGLKVIDQILSDEELIALSEQAYTACQQRFEEDGIEFGWFDSVENAADVVYVMEALGYQTFNFYGVSYGTMLGQHLLRDFPDRLRSVILDAVAPLDEDFASYVPNSAQRSLDLLFSTCAADAACSEAYPTLEADFYSVVETLNASPVEVEVVDSATGDSYTVLLNGDGLIGFIFFLFYITELIPSLPGFIQDVAAGDYSLIQGLADFYFFDRTFADAMYLAVVCAEDPDVIEGEAIYAKVNPLVVAAMDGRADIQSACATINVEAFESFIDENPTSDVPTLLINGEFDPITPPAGAEFVAESLSNSFTFIFPGIGHGVYLSQPCAEGMMVEFLADPFTEPASDCVDDYQITFEVPFDISAISMTSETVGFETLIPDGWEEVNRGSFASPDNLINFAVRAYFNTTIEEVLAFLEGRLGIPPFELLREAEGSGYDWEVYTSEDGGALYSLTVTTQQNATYGVFLRSVPGDWETLYESMVIPAIENFVILE